MASTHKNIFASHGFLVSHAMFEAGISKSRVRVISQPNVPPQTMVIGMISCSLGNERKPRPFCAFRVGSVSSIDCAVSMSGVHRVIPENSLDCVVSGQGLDYGMVSLNSLDYVGSLNEFDHEDSEKEGSGYLVPESDTEFNVSRIGKDINDYVFPGRDEDGMTPPTTITDVEGVNLENTKGLNISKLGLEKELVEALRKRGITNMFPIQEAVFKPATEGLDIIGRARTGTGKTMAFGIPIIQSLLKHNKQNRTRNPRALVLAPTRELAMQVEKEFMESTTNLSTLCVYGGVSIAGQQRKLERGVDIAVGTPGRIIDLIEHGSLVLNEVRYLVLDESDQMLAVGFAEDVERILENVPKERQSMLFSATMPDWVKQLARKHLKKPLTIDLVGDSKEKLADGIKVLSIVIPVSAKRSVLSDLITLYGKGGKTIVFTQTKKDADEVSLSLNRMLGAEALHGDITQVQREKTLAAFRNGKFAVLVATDVAARGLDVANVDLVIHFEIPNDSETFVHRSGRTGRAGKDGITILMYTDSQIRTVKMIERDIGCKFELIKAPSPHDLLRASSDQALEALNRVHPELRSVFLPMAEMLLQEQGAHALAAAIAYLSGFIQPPLSMSLATQEQSMQLSKLQHDEDPWDRYGRFAVQGGRRGGQYGRSFTSGNRGPYRREEPRSGIRDHGSNGNGNVGYQGGNVGYQGISVVYRGIDGQFQRSIPSCFICGYPGHKAAVCPKR